MRSPLQRTPLRPHVRAASPAPQVRRSKPSRAQAETPPDVHIGGDEGVSRAMAAALRHRLPRDSDGAVGIERLMVYIDATTGPVQAVLQEDDAQALPRFHVIRRGRHTFVRATRRWTGASPPGAGAALPVVTGARGMDQHGMPGPQANGQEVCGRGRGDAPPEAPVGQADAWHLTGRQTAPPFVCA